MPGQIELWIAELLPIAGRFKVEIDTVALGRVRVEVLGGLVTTAVRETKYFDAFQESGNGYVRLPGKYMALDFESGQLSWAGGIDAEIAVTRNFRIVPMPRYRWSSDPGRSMTYGVATSWRF